jgi:polyhydroxyalkanoic acid synthase PhaR subunit
MKGVQAMPQEGNSREPADPMKLWEPWYETASKAWSNTRDGSKQAYVDPFGFYQTWLKSVGNAQEQVQEQLKAGSFGTMDPKEAWKLWFETATTIWEKAIGKGTDPLGLTTQWLEMMEEARARILAETNIPADPFTLLKQWYDATSESWATVIGDIIGTERFMESSSQFLESYASLYRTFRRANEVFFSNLQLPTRSDIARVAELVIEVEDKVEQVEDAIEDLEDNYSKVVSSTLDGRFDQVENKLAALPTVLQKLTTVDALEKRLDQVERKVDALPAALQKLTTVDALEKRLDSVESKLDKLLIVLEKIEAKESPKTSRPTTPTPGKAQAAKREPSKGQALPVEAESVSRRTK